MEHHTNSVFVSHIYPNKYRGIVCFAALLHSLKSYYTCLFHLDDLFYAKLNNQRLPAVSGVFRVRSDYRRVSNPLPKNSHWKILVRLLWKIKWSLVVDVSACNILPAN